MAPPASVKTRFLLRKLHSLSGVIPVGAFLVEHLWTNTSALRGQASFDDAVDQIQRLPALPLIELFTIVLPLAFHAGYGVVLMRSAEPNIDRYPLGRNWLYVAQRVTGVLTLLFVLWHLWELRIQKWLFGMDSHSFFPVLTAHLSSTWHGVPLLALVYVVGVASAVFHFANGLWGFAASWGLVTTQGAMARVRTAGAVLGVLLFLMGESTVLYFATGTSPFSEPARTPAPCGNGSAAR
jgi:succinate dehydrogenase/fumarate reductase cytochrome b subunit (b558 family)